MTTSAQAAKILQQQSAILAVNRSGEIVAIIPSAHEPTSREIQFLRARFPGAGLRYLERSDLRQVDVENVVAEIAEGFKLVDNLPQGRRGP
jgi:hypothetical protein